MARDPHSDPTPTDGPAPLLGTAPTRRTSRFSGFTFSRPRVLVVTAVLILVVGGSLLPYLSMPYVTYAVELAEFRAPLFPAAKFVRGIEPLWLPGYEPGPMTDQITRALNVFNLGPSFQQIGTVLAVTTVGSLFQNEMNKFFFWPLHITGWLLTLSPVPLFVGAALLHRADVAVTLLPGWVPVTLAGVVILVTTFRARNRIDTYGGV